MALKYLCVLALRKLRVSVGIDCGPLVDIKWPGGP